MCARSRFVTSGPRAYCESHPQFISSAGGRSPREILILVVMFISDLMPGANLGNFCVCRWIVLCCLYAVFATESNGVPHSRGLAHAASTYCLVDGWDQHFEQQSTGLFQPRVNASLIPTKSLLQSRTALSCRPFLLTSSPAVASTERMLDSWLSWTQNKTIVDNFMRFALLHSLQADANGSTEVPAQPADVSFDMDQRTTGMGFGAQPSAAGDVHYPQSIVPDLLAHTSDILQLQAVSGSPLNQTAATNNAGADWVRLCEAAGLDNTEPTGACSSRFEVRWLDTQGGHNAGSSAALRALGRLYVPTVTWRSQMEAGLISNISVPVEDVWSRYIVRVTDSTDNGGGSGNSTNEMPSQRLPKCMSTSPVDHSSDHHGLERRLRHGVLWSMEVRSGNSSALRPFTIQASLGCIRHHGHCSCHFRGIHAIMHSQNQNHTMQLGVVAVCSCSDLVSAAALTQPASMIWPYNASAVDNFTSNPSQSVSSLPVKGHFTITLPHSIVSNLSASSQDSSEAAVPTAVSIEVPHGWDVTVACAAHVHELPWVGVVGLATIADFVGGVHHGPRYGWSGGVKGPSDPLQCVLENVAIRITTSKLTQTIASEALGWRVSGGDDVTSLLSWGVMDRWMRADANLTSRAMIHGLQLQSMATAPVCDDWKSHQECEEAIIAYQRVWPVLQLRDFHAVVLSSLRVLSSHPTAVAHIRVSVPGQLVTHGSITAAAALRHRYTEQQRFGGVHVWNVACLGDIGAAGVGVCVNVSVASGLRTERPLCDAFMASALDQLQVSDDSSVSVELPPSLGFRVLWMQSLSSMTGALYVHSRPCPVEVGDEVLISYIDQRFGPLSRGTTAVTMLRDRFRVAWGGVVPQLPSHIRYVVLDAVVVGRSEAEDDRPVTIDSDSLAFSSHAVTTAFMFYGQGYEAVGQQGSTFRRINFHMREAAFHSMTHSSLLGFAQCSLTDGFLTHIGMSVHSWTASSGRAKQ